MTKLFDAAVVSGWAAILPKRRAIAEEFAMKASKFLVKGSSDWQQYKHAPLWNLSLQPSPTYFFSKRVFYVHIFTMESFGDTTGVTKFYRKLVYVREQRVGC